MQAMQFILEFEGPLFDTTEACFQAHLQAADAVSWARLDRARFLRSFRKCDDAAGVLPGAPAARLSAYRRRFVEQLESDASIRAFAARSDLSENLTALKRFGAIDLVTLGTRLPPRKACLAEVAASSVFTQFECLNADPRLRPAELKVLSRGNPRTIVIACSDALIRAADETELITVGLTCGLCAEARLHRAGVRVVFRTLRELLDDLRSGAPVLIRAGLLPMPLG